LSWGFVKYISMSKYSFLSNTGILFIPVLIFLGLISNRMRRRKDKIAYAVVLIGVVIMLFPTDYKFQFYDFIVLFYTFLCGFYSVIFQKICKGPYAGIYQGLAFLYNGLFVFIINGCKVSISLTLPVAGKFLYIIIIGTVLMQTIAVICYKKLDLHIITTCSLTTPIYANILGILFLSEKVDIRVIIGGIIILVGIYIFSLTRKVIYSEGIRNKN